MTWTLVATSRSVVSPNVAMTLATLVSNIFQTINAIWNAATWPATKRRKFFNLIIDGKSIIAQRDYPMRHKTPAARWVIKPVSWLILVIVCWWQCGHIIVTGLSPRCHCWLMITTAKSKSLINDNCRTKKLEVKLQLTLLLWHLMLHDLWLIHRLSSDRILWILVHAWIPAWICRWLWLWIMRWRDTH